MLILLELATSSGDIFPAPPQQVPGGLGYAWRGATLPQAGPSAPVTTGWTISVTPGGTILYQCTFVPAPPLFGFVPGSSPAGTPPGTWYQGQYAAALSQIAFSLGGQFAPADQTLWWVWVQTGGTTYQCGQLLVD